MHIFPNQPQTPGDRYGTRTKVDLCFQILGKQIPVDHGFALYGAISRMLPFFHEDQTVGLKLIRGRYISDGMLDISPYSELVLHLPVGLHSAFYLSICLKNLKDFAFLMAQSGIYGKSPNSTSTTFCKGNGTVPAQPF